MQMTQPFIFMKKCLLTLTVLASALGLQAQEYAFVDGTALGLNDASTTTVSAGTVFASSTNITLSAAFDDSYKIVSSNGPKINDVSMAYYTVNGTQLNTSDGAIQGNTNPKDANGTTPSSSLAPPTGGAVIQATTQTEGYLYVFIKASSNKSYTVFEEGSPLGYTYVQATDGTTALPSVFGYTLTGDAEYDYLDLTSYPLGVLWPEQIYSNVTTSDGVTSWTKIGQNGLGVLKIKVYPDVTYLINANGSKITFNGYYFDTTGDATIKISNDNGDNLTLLDNGSVNTGIQQISKEESTKNQATYNTLGQRVSKSSQGVVIRNGKKYIQKQ